MKKIISVLLCAFLLSAVFIGCGEKKKENPPLNPGSSEPTSSAVGPVTEEQAGELAMNHAGTESKYVTGYRLESDMDDGQKTYDIEFFSDGHHYEYEIDPATGQIISFDKD